MEYFSQSKLLIWNNRIRSRRDFLLRKLQQNILNILYVTESNPNIPFVTSPTLHWDSGVWWKRPTLPLVLHVESSAKNVFYFSFCAWMFRICFTGLPLKTVMSSFNRACHGPGGVLSVRGVIFKMPFTETQTTGCGPVHLWWSAKRLRSRSHYHHRHDKADSTSVAVYISVTWIKEQHLSATNMVF